MIIYQVFTRLFRSGKFSAFDAAAFKYMKGLGISHVWYTGIPRHSTGLPYVKGNPGSPYSVIDYYDTNPYLADNPDSRMEEFKALVDRTHTAGFKVIIDFVPNHVSPDYHDRFGAIPNCGHCDYDWTDTVKIDYSLRHTWSRMKDIVEYWAGFGVDGFRCDMAELVPLGFWEYLTSEIKDSHPGVIFIGEVYETGRYQSFIDSGFDYLYDKSGLYDTLRAVLGGTMRAYDITHNWQRLGALQPHMLNFLENHDEQRLASPWFAGHAAKGYAALAVSALFYPCPFMMYFGQEIGEDASDGHQGRTSIFDFCRVIDPCGKLDAGQKRILGRYRDILKLSRKCGDWANYDLCYAQNAANGFDFRYHFAFLRHAEGKAILVVCNFSQWDASFKINIPEEAPAPSGIYEVQVSAWDCLCLML